MPLLAVAWLGFGHSRPLRLTRARPAAHSRPQGVFVGLEKGPGHACAVTARTACLVATWDLEDLNFLATAAGPAVAAHWRNFTLCE
jgi:hypothetical protein